MSHETVDAVVVGSGPNGLVAANLLADRGWDVLVLEAAEEPGGAVRSAELTTPGFRHDMCSAFYPLGVASPVLAGLRLERYGLTWRHAPAVLAHVLPDDRCPMLWRDPAGTAASVESFAAGDGRAWIAEFTAWQRIGRDLIETLLRPFPPVRPALRLGRTLGGAAGLRLARRATLPVRRLAEETFTGQGAQLLYAGSALHTDLAPDQTCSGLFGWILSMLGQEVGFPVPRGGAQSLTDALVRRLAGRGGTVACGRRVSKVLIARGRAVGVQDGIGRLVRARRAVLADVSAPALYLDLVGVEHLPPRLVADVGRFQWDNGSVKVDWALSGPVPWSAAEARLAGTVHLGGDMAGLAEYSADLSARRTPEHPFLVVGQMATADPTRSPAGTETLWAYTHVPRDGEWTRARLDQFGDHVQGIIETHAPGFTDRILARAVHGPKDIEEHDPNLVGGAVNGGTAALHQQLIFRPVPGLARADTPIDRLFLASASAHPGGAVHGAAGANAARAALIRAGPGGGLYATTVGWANRLIYAGEPALSEAAPREFHG